MSKEDSTGLRFVFQSETGHSMEYVNYSKVEAEAQFETDKNLPPNADKYKETITMKDKNLKTTLKITDVKIQT